jgi:hypothetical protein
MENNEIHQKPSVFVSVLASLLLPAWSPCNHLKITGTLIASRKKWVPQSLTTIIHLAVHHTLARALASPSRMTNDRKLTSICLADGKSLYVCSFCSFFGYALVAASFRCARCCCAWLLWRIFTLLRSRTPLLLHRRPSAFGIRKSRLINPISMGLCLWIPTK